LEEGLLNIINGIWPKSEKETPDLNEANVFIPTAVEFEKTRKQMLPHIEKLIADNPESRTLAALRDALLPKLLSGDLGVGKNTR
jgi:hypothetical protein